MSTPIITTGGGGHNAMRFIQDNYADMRPDERADAVELVRDFVDGVNKLFNQKFDTTNL